MLHLHIRKIPPAAKAAAIMPHSQLQKLAKLPASHLKAVCLAALKAVAAAADRLVEGLRAAAAAAAADVDVQVGISARVTHIPSVCGHLQRIISHHTSAMLT
jgi:hypothetical protein